MVVSLSGVVDRTVLAGYYSVPSFVVVVVGTVVVFGVRRGQSQYRRLHLLPGRVTVDFVGKHCVKQATQQKSLENLTDIALSEII